MGQNKVPFHIWEGIFDDFKSAGGFDESFRHPIWYQNLQERTQKLLTQYNKDRRIPSYPVAHEHPLTTLAALAAHPTRTLRILDFGGAMGHDFLAVAASLPENQPLDYVVVELPEIVEKAKTIFPSDTRITFTNSLPNEAHTFDIVHTASALHYCEDWKGTLRDLALLSNKYFSLCDIPAGSIPTFVSLQNFYGSKFRHWFWNIDEFLLAMN
ncbi:uncharacterized protein METZ01_LOCUS433902, partial [marine metagenome]